MWHVQTDPQTIQVSPAIAGRLVTLPQEALQQHATLRIALYLKRLEGILLFERKEVRRRQVGVEVTFNDERASGLQLDLYPKIE